MSKMKDFSMTLDEIIDAGETMVSSYKETAGALEIILTAVKDLKALFGSEAPTAPAIPEKPAAKKQTKDAPAKEKESEPKPEPAKEYSFTDVRGIMAGLAGQGKKAEARALLQKFGAARLSEVKPEDYAALVQEAQVIANG